MKTRSWSWFLAGALAVGTAHAGDLAPGLWQITVDTRLPGALGTTSAPLGLSQCLTAADARDPSQLVGALAMPGGSGCRYTEATYVGNTFRFVLDCSTTYALKAAGSVSFDADNFSGTVTTTANVLGGQAMELESRITAKRVGGC